ncbi:MAG: transglycosylase domain-containing protein [Bacteroidota bacterium]
MPQNEDKSRKYLTILWSVYGFLFFTTVLIFVLISREKFGPMPTFDELENPQTNLASEIYSDNGELLGKFFVENRTFVGYKNLSPYLVDALIATEDIRFNKHSGIDLRSLGRVVVRTLLLGQNTGGGSTISQQLAKNLFPRDTIYRRFMPARATHMAITKFKEWNTAVRLERSYTKSEIIVMYLNTVPFGGGAIVGIKSAARTFFNTSPDSLNLEQSAVLIGMLKAPSAFNPKNNPERSFNRRNTVLDQMVKYGYLDSGIADSVRQLPIVLDYNLASHTQGYGTYFRAFLQKIMYEKKPEKKNYPSWAMEAYQRDSMRWANDPLYGWVAKNPRPDGTYYNLFRDGLKIHTTINIRMQQYAEEAMDAHLAGDLQPAFFKEKKGRSNAPFEEITKKDVDRIMISSMRRTDRYRRLQMAGVSQDSIWESFRTPVPMRVFTWQGDRDTVMTPYDSIRYYKYFLQSGFMAMEPWSGHVKAYVGGANYTYFQYDHVTQGRRQVGSTIKPFLYLLAMQEGYSPCDYIPLVPISFQANDSVYTPRATGENPLANEQVTLKWGLANSHNWVSAWLFKNFNPESVIRVMRKMGVTSYIDPVPSMIYGPSDISLEEMVGAYNTFSNKGIYVSPVYVTRVEDRYGNLISTFNARETEAISEETAFLMVSLLRQVVDMTGTFKGHYYAGTANRLRWRYEFTGEMGGKTGTTQNQSDGWFMGITPRLSAGVWVGCEDRAAHFNSLSLGSGTNMALPIWGEFFKRVYADSTLLITQEDEFEKPLNFNVSLNCPDVKSAAGNGSIDNF